MRGIDSHSGILGWDEVMTPEVGREVVSQNDTEGDTGTMTMYE